MVQSTKNRHRHHIPIFWRIDGPRFRAIIVEPLVRPFCVVVIFDVIFQYSLKVPFSQNDDMIHTLTTERTDYTLADSVHLRRFPCGDDLLDIHRADSPVEFPLKSRIAIVNKKSRCGIIGKSVAELYGRPFRPGDVEMYDSPTRMLDEYQHMQRLEPNGRNRKKVTGDNISCVIAKKRRPILRGWFRGTDHLLLDSRLADGVSQLRKLTLDTRGTPGRIFRRYLPYQFPHLDRDLRAPHPPTAFESPEYFEALAVPTDERLRFDNHENISPSTQYLRSNHQKQTVAVFKLWFGLLARENCQLLTTPFGLHRPD